jgi:MFS superfamily sulfate permease-like transporter
MCSCSADGLVKGVMKTIPFIRIMKKYKPRTDLPSDIIAGFTVGVMQLPQGRSITK